jgi:hypothetical protein
MREYKDVQVIAQADKKVTCNKCGKVYIYTDNNVNNIINSNLFQNIKLNFGFGSMYDGSYVEIDLCENCIIELINSCKHNPMEEI